MSITFSRCYSQGLKPIYKRNVLDTLGKCANPKQLGWQHLCLCWMGLRVDIGWK